MSKVTDLNPPPKSGSSAYLLCGCNESGVPLAGGAEVSENPQIDHLWCPECGASIPVTNGYVDFEG